MVWLSSRRIWDSEAGPAPKPREVLKALPAFQARLHELGDDWVTARVPWKEVCEAAKENIPKL
jgi:hypothetical protein